MASKNKRDYQKIKERIDELAAKAKGGEATPEEKFELEQKREIIRRHAHDEKMKAAKAAIVEGKKAALLKILDANGIKTENDLKDILRFVQETKPDLIPARREATETPKEDGGGATEGDAGTGTEATPEEKNENGDEGTSAAESQTGEAPVCENCGTQAIRKYSKRKEKEYWICPNYNDNDKNHYFKWLD